MAQIADQISFGAFDKYNVQRIVKLKSETPKKIMIANFRLTKIAQINKINALNSKINNGGEMVTRPNNN